MLLLLELLTEFAREADEVALVAPTDDAPLLVMDEVLPPLFTDDVELLANPPAVPLEP